jgi:histone-lysine N-methyltransferase SETD8
LLDERYLLSYYKASLSSLGRLINHSRKNSNCQPKVFVIRDQPRLVLVALRDIDKDEELFYDYGERRKDIVESFPWLNE